MGEIAEIFDSLRKPVTKSDRKSGPYPYYGASGVQDYVDSYLFDGRYLLVGEDGAKWGAGDKSAYIIEGKSWVNNHAHILKVRNNILDKYLEYYLVFSDLTEYITGAIVPKLTQKALCSIPIPIPPIDEQKRIVDELDLITGIIDKKNAQLRDLDALALAIYHEMFDGHEEWQKGTIKDVYSFQYGKGNNIPEDKGNYPCYGSNGIVGHHIAYNSENAPVIGHIGAYAGIVNWASGKHYVTYNGVICRINEGYDPIYGLYLLKAQDYLNAARRGGAQPFVSYDMLYDPCIFIPPYHLQNVFANRVAVIDKEKKAISSSLIDLNQLLSSRMDHYFND